MALKRPKKPASEEAAGDEAWMLAREERGRLNTALLQPMAIYEATGQKYSGIPFWLRYFRGAFALVEAWCRWRAPECLGEELVSHVSQPRV